VRDRSTVSIDPLSDFLRLAEASSVMSGGFAAGGTWALRFAPPGQIVFAAIARGGCWIRLDGQRKAVRVEEGDIGLLPGRRGYLLASDLTATPRDVVFTGPDPRIETIGDGSGCVVLAGKVALHPSSAALLTDVLPPMILVRASSPRAASLRWILKELQLLRAHLGSLDKTPPGWLRAMGDERILRALRLIHDDPARPWRLEELADAAAMSRTRFAVLFSAVAGVAPITYLTEWRMRLAQRRLRDDDTSLASLSSSLGYASESAFSNAFKRVTGVAPSAYRSAAREAQVAPA
jgi:AraC-like DNA-binding protein